MLGRRVCGQPICWSATSLCNRECQGPIHIMGANSGSSPLEPGSDSGYFASKAYLSGVIFRLAGPPHPGDTGGCAAACLKHAASGGDANTSASALSDPANDSRSTSGGDDDSLPDARHRGAAQLRGERSCRSNGAAHGVGDEQLQRRTWAGGSVLRRLSRLERQSRRRRPYLQRPASTSAPVTLSCRVQRLVGFCHGRTAACCARKQRTFLPTIARRACV